MSLEREELRKYSMIRCEGLTKWYGDFLALDQLDLELAPGDLFGFIGPNGAGKTTTMKILATLLSPTSGRAFVGGHDVMRSPEEVRRLVGYMPDFFGVYREMRVAEYLAFFAAAYRVPSSRRNVVVEDLLTLVDLRHKSQDLVGALSRGMQQRLGLARALVHDPQVLILDEPASGLDPRARVEVREILKELRNMGKTIVLSSHILPELADVCNRIGVIARGRLLAFGSLDEVSHGVAPARVHVRIARVSGEGEGGEGPGEGGEPEGPPARVQAAMEALRQRLEVPVVYDALGDMICVTPSADSEVASEDVATLLIGSGFGLRYLQVVRPSLEEVFLHLTEDHELGGESGQGA